MGLPKDVVKFRVLLPVREKGASVVLLGLYLLQRRQHHQHGVWRTALFCVI
jgi:hypothetical protein